MAKVELLSDVDRMLAQTCQGIPSGPGDRDTHPAIYLDERKLLQAALDEPYDGLDASKMGLSKMVATAKAVASQASEGVPWAVEFVFNRLYGRPKQTIATANLNMTLKDYLSHLAKGESPETPISDAEVIANGE